MEKNNNINPDSMIPMYKQIVNLLNEKIEKGELEPGDKLPSEAELMEAYSVSRITIRSAISELEEDGLVIRSRGKGHLLHLKKAMYSADDTVGLHIHVSRRKTGYYKSGRCVMDISDDVRHTISRYRRRYNDFMHKAFTLCR